MVHGIVEEQDLGRIHKHGQEGIHLVGKHPVDTGTEQLCERVDHVADDEVSRDRQYHGDDAQGEIVHKHLESCPHFSLHQLVEPLHAPAGHRAHNHGSEEHRGVGSDDDAHGGYSSGHSTSISTDVFTGGECYKGG